MRRTVHVRSAALMATGLLAVACGNSSTSTSTSTVTVTGATSGSPTSTTATVDLPSLLPVPAGNQRADGPDPVGENGIHKHFLVNGAPTDVMNAYKAVLEGAGWVDDDGRSTMPAYPDLTVRQLGDLVAYLTSLKQDAAAASAHEAMTGRGIQPIFGMPCSSFSGS